MPKRKSGDRSKEQPATPAPHLDLECEVVPGLEEIARAEIEQQLNVKTATPVLNSGRIRFSYRGQPDKIFRLSTVNAAYQVLEFPIPRPRALLGHEYLHYLLAAINTIRSLHPQGAFQTMRLDAAGSDSSIMQRLKAELSAESGLIQDNTAGDLLMRIRRPPNGRSGWEVLLRLTPRPLSAREWRVCNFEGALVATAARAMLTLLKPRPDDIFLNVGCGSGTFLIERALGLPAGQIIGVDRDPAALACSQVNIDHAEAAQVRLINADGRSLPFAARSVSSLCADLPFGQLVGSHEDNLDLYPALLQEAARVARPGGFLALITHEIRLIEKVLREQAEVWQLLRTLPITLRGLHPRIYLLRRKT